MQICAILPGVAAIAIIAACYYANRRHFPIEAPAAAATGICVVLQIISFLKLPASWIPCSSDTSSSDNLKLINALLAFITINILILEPVNFTLNHTRAFVYAFEAKRQQAHAELGFYDFGRDAVAIKFMSNLPPFEIASKVDPLFINDINTVLDLNKKVYYITWPEIYDAIPTHLKQQLTVLGHAEIGHGDVVIFAVTKQLGENDVHSFR